MPQTQYALHLKGFVGGTDFDRNYLTSSLKNRVFYKRLNNNIL